MDTCILLGNGSIQENTSDSKEVSKAKRQPKGAASQTSSSSHHNPAKRVSHHGKTTRASRTSSLKVIAHDVVILNTDNFRCPVSRHKCKIC